MIDTPEVVAALRVEITESQKTQAEFLKWKLIAVSAIGSISLGFVPSTSLPSKSSALEALLCLIPLICAYTDFISLHIMIRIVTIGAYLNKIGSEYESFVFLTRDKGANPFVFETAALHGSTIIFNIVLIGISFSPIATGWVPQAYLLSGLLGFGVAVVSWILYTMRAKRVVELSQRS